MTFGNSFGLALYDKQQRQVSGGTAPAQSQPAENKPAQAQLTQAKPAQPRAATTECPLEPAAITALQERIKALAPARLTAFSKGFRAAFQVPAAQASLAGLITSSLHQRWIEGFLADGASA
jgi:hypothetical protein